MLGVKKMINIDGLQTFYVYTENGVIEISVKRDFGISWNYLGPVNHFSSSIASVQIMREENEDVYMIFDKLYTGIIDEEKNIRNKKNDLPSYYGKAVKELVKNENVEWKSDSLFGNGANTLVIEPIVNGYVVTFKKGKFLDGRNNRDYRVKFGFENSRYYPLNGYFIEMYKDFKGIDDMDVVDQSSYNRSHRLVLENK